MRRKWSAAWSAGCSAVTTAGAAGCTTSPSRRRGLATALVSRAQAELAKAGIHRIHALILAGNRDAMQFWFAAGWRQREDLSVVSFEFSAATLN